MGTRKTLCVVTSLFILLLEVGVQPSAAEEIFVDGVRRLEKEIGGLHGLPEGSCGAVQGMTETKVVVRAESGEAGDRIVNGVPCLEADYQARFRRSERSYGGPHVVTETKVMVGAEPGAAEERFLNGLPYFENADPKERQELDVEGFAKTESTESTADVVGSVMDSATDFALAKGNSYRVDTTTFLREAEFWLNFSDTQTLSFYVFQSPVEFGTYDLTWSRTSSVNGVGASWYSTGPLDVLLEAGNHYIIAVSWDGTMTYFFGGGDSEPTSFGAHTHGYASGVHPLGIQITSSTNDTAIYHQRLTSDVATADVVGSVMDSATDFALAKGNSYRVDTTTFLREAEFWLNFSDTQTLSFYVFQSPVEFGTYDLTWSRTSSVNGVGASWYSAGPLDVLLEAGNHYIIAVSWDGTMTYFFGMGDSEPTSFGAHTHGYASGIHPLGNQITSSTNDVAIYHQRLTKSEMIFEDGFESGNTAAWSSMVP